MNDPINPDATFGSEVSLPQASDLADKGALPDTSARGGGVNVSGSIFVVPRVGTPGVPSNFASGFPPAPVAPSSSSSTVYLFSGGSEVMKTLCSDKYAQLREDEQDRVLTSLPKSSQQHLVHVSNNLRTGMLSETRVARR